MTHVRMTTPTSYSAWKPSVLVLALVFLTSVMVGSLTYFMVERMASRDRVLPTVFALGVPLGGLSGSALVDAVRSLSPRTERLAGKVRVGNRTFDVSASAVGLVLDVEGTTAHALASGRSGSWLRQVGWFFVRPFSRTALPIVVHLDAEKTRALLEGFERAALGDPAVEGSVGFTDRVVPTHPRAGVAIVQSHASRLIELALIASHGDAVPLPTESRKPLLSRADVDRACIEAERLIATPVVLQTASGEAQITFTGLDLGRALRSRLSTTPAPHLDVFLEPQALRDVIDRARPALEKAARNATFAVGSRHEVTLVPSELGTRLDDDAILRSVLDLTRGSERQGTLAMQKDVMPALSTEQAEALHVRGLVSQFTTPFPCCEARVHNIERMAALVDGTIVRPGDPLSLNTLSGPRTAANGFVSGPTIVEGEMEMTVGGGVSQFATTLFNAVFDGGYEILQRQAHTYWFPRYPEGHDATLGYPLPDLVFRNDSESGMLIKTTVGRTFVRVEIYGDNGGRHVERHVSPRFDIVRPETMLEPNASLSPDETKVKFGGAIGWSLEVSRTVTFADLHKTEERRKVTYSPRARRVETHPCRIPEGTPGHTGEKCPKVEAADGGTG